MIIRVTGQLTVITGEGGGRGRCYALDVAFRRAQAVISKVVINDLVPVSMTLATPCALRLGAHHRPSGLSDDQSISA